MNIKQLGALSLVGFMLAGCADQYGNQGGNSILNKQNVGAVLGGATGAALGSNVGKGKGQIAAIAAGTLLGAMAGSGIGASLDRADQTYYAQGANQTFESAKTGQTVTWVNPDSGNSGTFTPTNTYQAQDGKYCREYTQTVVVSGRKQQAYGVACRERDGSWRIVQ